MVEHDANVAEILPAEQREKEERKQELKQELASQAQGKMSTRKKKRLDKYIVRQSFSLSLHLRSSSPVTHRA